jgi:uncharacterized protein with NRDE domain
LPRFRRAAGPIVRAAPVPAIDISRSDDVPMCLILFALDAHPRWRLVVAANRDEFFARPTAPAEWWADAPEVLAGRDLRDGGTWMGITRAGRFAAVTNYREPNRYTVGAPSRGKLVADFLLGGSSSEAYAGDLLRRGQAFNGFNLLVGDADGLVWLSNRSEEMRRIDPGVHGLSNHLLDTPWPKVVRGKEDLHRALAGSDDALESALFASLALRDPAPDAALPSTGIEMQRERALSAAFIVSPEYGTRASTVLLVSHDGKVRFTERTTVPAEDRWTEARHEFRIGSANAAS